MLSTRTHWAPLSLRLILGFGFVYHGIPKLFSASGHAMFVGMLQNIGVPAAEPTAWFVGGVELVGGMALIAGAFTSIASAALLINMLVALFTVHLPNGFNFINITGLSDAGPQFGMPGYEVPLLYIGGLLTLLVFGPSRFSVDERLAARAADTNASGQEAAPVKRVASIAAMALLGVTTLFATGACAAGSSATSGAPAASAERFEIRYNTALIADQEIFYRDAGPADAPTVLLLHGFPTSSHMFRNLIPALADRYHLIAPDYPGFGNSSMPSVDEFEYTFDRLTDIVEQLTEQLEIERYTIYLMDYGAPVGYRLALRHPDRVEALIIQNGNAYDEGLQEFWDPIKAFWRDSSAENGDALRSLLTLGATTWQYTHGTRDSRAISPDNWNLDQRFLDRPGNQEIQLQLFYDYGSNPGRYPAWQAYFREYQPPALIVWGKNDYIFPADGAHPYLRDLETVEFHLLDTGHFALEEDGAAIASLMRDFLARHVK